MEVYIALVGVVCWSTGVLALVPIPLEPQRACFTHFGECIRYCPGERVPDLVGTESSCITNADGYQFCKFYHCPPKPCRRDLRKKDLYGKCYYCPGNCIDGNNIHRNGEGFLSIDMVNTCFCGQNNYKHCEKKPVDQFSFCNHAHPNDGGNSAKIVVVERPPPPPPETKVVVVEKPPPPPQTKVVVVKPPPTPPPPPQQVATAYAKPRQTPPPPPQQAYMNPQPTQPPYQPPYVQQPPTQAAYQPYPTPYPNHHQTYPPRQQYVPNPPTHPPAAHSAVYVSVPQPPTPPHFGFLPPPGYHHQHVAHPDFSAKSPKSNLNQRHHSNPHLQGNTAHYNAHQNPYPYGNNHPFNNYNFNPFIGPFPWNQGKKKDKKEIEV